MEEGRGSEYGCPGGMVQIFSTKTWALGGWEIISDCSTLTSRMVEIWTPSSIQKHLQTTNSSNSNLYIKKCPDKIIWNKQKWIFEVRLKKTPKTHVWRLDFFQGAGAGDDESNPPTIPLSPWVRRGNFQVKEVRVWWLWPSEENTMEVKTGRSEVFWCGGLGRFFFPVPKSSGKFVAGTKKGSLGGSWKNGWVAEVLVCSFMFLHICSFSVVVFTIRGKNSYSKPWVVYSMYPGC